MLVTFGFMQLFDQTKSNYKKIIQIFDRTQPGGSTGPSKSSKRGAFAVLPNKVGNLGVVYKTSLGN